MTVNDYLDKFWRYYLILEERFENSIRYVELNTDNFSTYSIDFVNQIQMIGSEIDVIMKSMSGFNATDRKSITDYATEILANYPSIVNWEVKVRDISHKPFVGWNITSAANSLPWWEAYNNIKHGRDGNFREASLENVLNALMALYLLEMLYFKKLADNENKPDVITNGSKLFSIVGWQSRCMALNSMYAELNGSTLTINH